MAAQQGKTIGDAIAAIAGGLAMLTLLAAVLAWFVFFPVIGLLWFIEVLQ